MPAILQHQPCVTLTIGILPPGKLTCPLKINGWKMYVRIEIVPFQGTC